MEKTTGQRGKTAENVWNLFRLLIASAIVGIPSAILFFTPLASGVTFVLAGTIPAVMGLLFGRRVAIRAVVGTVVLVALVGFAKPYPLLATALMVILGLALGIAARRGWHVLAAAASGWPATFLLGPVFETPGAPWISAGVGQALTPAALALIGGVWAIVVGLAMLPGAGPRQFTPQSKRASIQYGVLLAVLLGVATFVASTWFPGGFAGWILLTILVIVRPEVADTKRRILNRTIGTVLGGAAAALLAFLVPVHGVLLVIGLIAMVAVLILQVVPVHYAIYAFVLTAAVVLLNTPDTNVVPIDFDRVVFTVAGAVSAALVVFGAELASHSFKREHAAETNALL